MKHTHVWALKGRPEKAARNGPGTRGGRVRGWSVRMRCATCRKTRRVKVSAAVMELKGAFA